MPGVGEALLDACDAVDNVEYFAGATEAAWGEECCAEVTDCEADTGEFIEVLEDATRDRDCDRDCGVDSEAADKDGVTDVELRAAAIRMETRGGAVGTAGRSLDFDLDLGGAATS